MRKMLVLGGTGLTGRRLAKTLLAQGSAVRCSVRNPAVARAKLPEAIEIVKGDIQDAASMNEAVRGVDAVFNCVHTLSKQAGAGSFVDAELTGIANLIDACRTNGVRRILYLTFLGMSADGTTEWGRGRWKAERMLLESGLDATILRPGQIVGKGGFGFDQMIAQARRRITLVLGNGRHRMQNIALDDLVQYLIRAAAEPRTFGRAFDVGSDDVLTSDQMIDLAADVLGKPAPRKVHLPASVLLPVAPLLERAAHLPKGAFRDLVAGMETDLVGDVRPLRDILGFAPRDYRSAIETALREQA